MVQEYGSINRMRTFFAIGLPEATRMALANVVKPLRVAPGRYSWVATENIHLTLRFLGDVSEDTVELLDRFCQKRFSQCGPLVLSPRGLGFFPNSRRPSVFWAGLLIERGNLEAVQSISEEAAHHIGLAAETKAFYPHLTLARIRDSRNAAPLARAVEEFGQFSSESFEVNSVTLYRSELLPRWARYTVLKEYSLQ